MEPTVLMYNQKARDLLANHKPVKAVALLQKAQGIVEQTSEDSHLKATIAKNLGLAYKAAEHWHKAIESFSRGLELEADDPREQAWLHLNLASVYCSLHKHKNALGHNTSARLLLQSLSQSTSSASMLAVAFHNCAEELIHLEEPQEAAVILKQGHDIVSRILGKHHQLTLMLEEHQVRPVLRRVLLSSKPMSSPKTFRPSMKSRSVQRARQIYMQDIARTQTFIRRPRVNSRLDEVRHSIKDKVIKSRTSKYSGTIPSPGGRPLLKPPKYLKPSSVSKKLNRIEEKFAKVNLNLKQIESQNKELRDLVMVSRSSCASEISV